MVDVVVVDFALSAASIVEETSSWTVDEMGSKVPPNTVLEVDGCAEVVVDGCAEVASPPLGECVSVVFVTDVIFR